MRPNFECIVRSQSFYGDTPTEAFDRFACWLEHHEVVGDPSHDLNVSMCQITFSFSEALQQYVVQNTLPWAEDVDDHQCWEPEIHNDDIDY